MKWVSVKERVPSEHGGCCMHDVVLISDRETSDHAGGLALAQYYEEGWEILTPKFYSCVGEIGSMESREVTEWLDMNPHDAEKCEPIIKSGETNVMVVNGVKIPIERKNVKWIRKI